MTSVQRDWVRQRAGRRCEYCHLPDSAMEPEDFHVEHIIARKHGGSDEAEPELIWSDTGPFNPNDVGGT
jgi:5-methylcytosine-specific restriction endonuclease McrA